MERKLPFITATALVAIAVIGVGAIMFAGRAYMLPLATGFVFAVILAPLCTLLERIWMPTVIAAFLSMLVAGAVVYAGFAVVAQPAARWVAEAPQTLQKAEIQLRKFRKPLKSVQDFSHDVQDFSILPQAPKPRTVVVQGPELTESLFASAGAILVQAGFVLVLTYFFLLTRKEVRLKVIAFQRNLSDRVRAARVFRDVERGVSSYIVVFSLINLAAGAAVGLACWAIGLPEPAMWGGIAALLNFVPYLGPAATIGLLGLAGLSTFDTLLEASYPVLAYLGIGFIEGNIVTPAIMSRRMTLNPLGIVLAVSFWTWLWGPVGALISLPLLIMLKVTCDHTPSLRALGALLGGPLDRNGRRKLAEEAQEIAVANEDQPPLAEPIHPAKAAG